MRLSSSSDGLSLLGLGAGAASVSRAFFRWRSRALIERSPGSTLFYPFLKRAAGVDEPQRLVPDALVGTADLVLSERQR